MSRYIDADAIDYDFYWWNKGYSIQECQRAEQLINEQPTADVVEVVRCKDCSYGVRRMIMKSNIITFERFQKIYETIRKTTMITTTLFMLNDEMDEIPENLYVEIIRLHNAAVDYMEAYKKYVEFKEV